MGKSRGRYQKDYRGYVQAPLSGRDGEYRAGCDRGSVGEGQSLKAPGREDYREEEKPMDFTWQIILWKGWKED